MDESGNKNMEVDRLHLIDFSSEDDYLIASPSGSSLGDLQASGFPKEQKEHNSFECFVAGNTQEKKDSLDILEQREQAAPLFDSHELERTKKTGKCNLRKSLAWDSAFFTSSGVLEPEELTIINNGLKKADLHFLPGIEEDIRRSAESNSTLDSDSLTLESLEVDLFEDIRASIQRSSKTFNVVCSTSKSGLGKTSMENIHTSKKPDIALKKPDIASRDRAKPVYTSKKQIISMQGTEKMKEASVRQRPVQPAARSGVSNSSSLKPPKISSRANPITTEPTKRASLGARRVKMENTTAKTATGTAVLASKKPRSGYTCTVMPKSSFSSRSSSGSPIAAKESTVSCSSYNSSGRASSDATCKSPSSSMRRKVDSRNVNQVSPVSTIKTPRRISSRSKTDSGNYCLSNYLTSMPKLPSSISPASSIDGWSSESSSSTSTINKRSNRSKSSLDTSSSNGTLLDIDVPQASSVLRNHQQDQPCDGPEHKGTGLSSQHVKKGSTETGPLSNRSSANVSRSFKPSGLRMPSPKIGFFDAEKHVVRTPNGNLQLQPGVRSDLHKIGGGVSDVNGGVSYKTKPGKLQPARNVIGIGNIKLDSQQTGAQHPASSMRSVSLLPQLQEPSDASPMVFGSGTTETIPTISINTENKEGFDVANHGMGSGDQGDLMKKVSPTEDGLDFCWDASFSINCESLKPSKKEIKEVTYGKQSDDDTRDNLRSVESSEKENLYGFKDHVDGLSSQVDAMDLNRNPLKELIQMKGTSFSHFGANEADSDDRASSLPQ